MLQVGLTHVIRTCADVCVPAGAHAAERHRLRAERQQHLPQTRLHPRLAFPARAGQRQLLREDPALAGPIRGVHRLDTIICVCIFGVFTLAFIIIFSSFLCATFYSVIFILTV